MYAYQFETEIKDGTIKVPDEYVIGASSKVKVLLLPNASRRVDKASIFPDLKLKTNDIRFNRDEANER
jgi:hypothetical protein